MRQRSLARSTRRAKPMSSGRLDSQYFVGSFSPFRPFDQEPFFRPRLAAVEVTPCNADAHTRKTGLEGHVRSLAPSDRPPGLGRKAKGKILDLDRLVVRIATQLLGRPSAARHVGLGRQ